MVETPFDELEARVAGLERSLGRRLDQVDHRVREGLLAVDRARRGPGGLRPAGPAGVGGTAHIRVTEPPPVIHVSPTGDDGFDGRWDRPKLTVVAAVTSAGARGAVKAGPGVYLLDDLAPLAGQTIEGTGRETEFRAAGGAAQVMRIEGILQVVLRDLVIDGNAKASKGLVIKGSAVAGSQGHLFEGVDFRNATTACSVETNATTQADKNTYENCRFRDSDEGFRANTVNGQEQVFINPNFASNTTSIRMTSGSLNILGGQAQTHTTGLLIDGGNVQWVSLDGFIFESAVAGCIDIDGNTAWPTAGVILDHCILQGLGATVRLGVNGSVLRGRMTRFVNGNINATAGDVTFLDEFCAFAGGAAWNPTGANDRRWQQALNGLTVYLGAAEKLHLRDFDGHVFAQMWEGAEIADPAAPAANRGIAYFRDNGAGKTQLCARFPTGVVQVIATEP